MDEINRFSKRIKRYSDLGSSASSLAFKFLGSKIFKETNPTKNAESLSKMLGGLKGPIMKIAQLISTVPDILPQEYVQELTKLQSNAPPMGWNFVKRRMKNELGTDWFKKFCSFNCITKITSQDSGYTTFWCRFSLHTKNDTRNM